MPAYADVFQRVEKKYRLDAARRAALEEGLAAALAPDGYGRACITSLYLDTPERTLIDRSLEKPPYKEKLRLRAYGEPAGRALAAAFAGGAGLAAPAAVSGGAGLAAPAAADLGMPVFLEIKKKFRGVVYKRRVSLSLGAAVAYLDGVPYEEACAARPLADAALQQASLAPRSRQIARELDAALVRHGRLAPSMAIRCERVAWAPRESAEAGPRVTFDDRLVFLDFRFGLSPSSGPDGALSLGSNAAALPGPDGAAPLGPASVPLAPDSASALAWHPVIPAAEAIMEIKNAGPYPRWLAALLADVRAYPASFSKYGAAYQLAAKATFSAENGTDWRFGTVQASRPSPSSGVSPGQIFCERQNPPQGRQIAPESPPPPYQNANQCHPRPKNWRSLVKGGRCA